MSWTTRSRSKRKPSSPLAKRGSTRRRCKTRRNGRWYLLSKNSLLFTVLLTSQCRLCSNCLTSPNFLRKNKKSSEVMDLERSGTQTKFMRKEQISISYHTKNSWVLDGARKLDWNSALELSPFSPWTLSSSRSFNCSQPFLAPTGTKSTSPKPTAVWISWCS
jgi:hypothetical protein